MGRVYSPPRHIENALDDCTKLGSMQLIEKTIPLIETVFKAGTAAASLSHRKRVIQYLRKVIPPRRTNPKDKTKTSKS